jgi:hypothetical protein
MKRLVLGALLVCVASLAWSASYPEPNPLAVGQSTHHHPNSYTDYRDASGTTDFYYGGYWWGHNEDVVWPSWVYTADIFLERKDKTWYVVNYVTNERFEARIVGYEPNRKPYKVPAPVPPGKEI